MYQFTLNAQQSPLKTCGVRVYHTESSLTVLTGQCKQFPIPKEKRDTKKDHEDFFSFKLAVWVLRAV